MIEFTGGEFENGTHRVRYVFEGTKVSARFASPEQMDAFAGKEDEPIDIRYLMRLLLNITPDLSGLSSVPPGTVDIDYTLATPVQVTGFGLP